MDAYEIGRDIGELLCRVKSLEDRLATLEGKDCGCADTNMREATARALTKAEIGDYEGKDKKRQAAGYCQYVVTGFFGPACPGININDDLCIQPCPSCPPLRRINLLNANGTPMCSVQVIVATPNSCPACPPGGHKFVWV